MQAKDLKFTELLEGPKQFIIPIFQRTYSWEQSHCEQLWDDIVRVGEDSELNSHFIGSVVYIADPDTSAAIPRWLVIDGQQRLTTITLLLLAFKRRLEVEEIEEPVAPALIDDYYLKNRYGKGELGYKMLLTRTDKETLIARLDGKELGDTPSHRIVENFNFFADKIAKANLDVVYQGIQKLMIVHVSLKQGIDNPQMIFESMNSTGKALTQADLIRNFVLMGLKHDVQTRLYNEYWHPMEIKFGAEKYISEFDKFIRFYLVSKAHNPTILRQDVYDKFKAYSRQYDDVEVLLASLKEFAHYYCCIAFGTENDNELRVAFHDIQELGADVCYPLLMEVYQDYRDHRLTKNEFVDFVRMVESYVFRRAVCDIPTHSLLRTFATFTLNLKKDSYVENAMAIFLMLPSYRRFPRDKEFSRQIKTRNLYEFKRLKYWLRRFENFERKERVQLVEYTTEHIMPQNEKLSAKWRRELGEDWERIHEEYLHTLGNLTLTRYNSEYSDRPFSEKRDMKGGFAQSPLQLNKRLRSCEQWNEAAIKSRASELSKIATRIWVVPQLEEEVLLSYKPQVQGSTNYSRSDHPHLLGGLPSELFNAFRSEVIALDERVYEEYWKLYVAYKAETNFVNIVSQVKGLRLDINLEFPEIDDPRGLCNDMTNFKKWRMGTVQFDLTKLEDIPYAVGLVRQALEKQLDEDE